MNWRRAVMNWCFTSWFLVGIPPPPWFELPLSQCRRQFMHQRCNSWRSQFVPIGQFIACSLNEHAVRKADAIQEIKWIDGEPSWIDASHHDFSSAFRLLHDLNCPVPSMPKAIHAPQVQFMAQPIHAHRAIHCMLIEWACNLQKRKSDIPFPPHHCI